MLRMKLTILLAVLVSALNLFAGNNDKVELKKYSVSGKVIDSDGELIGVQVSVNNKNITVYTDIEGNFVINNIDASVQTLSFNMVSYKVKTINVSPSHSKNLEIRLYSK